MRIAFRDVKQNIRQRILDGEWAPGDLIPGEVELAASFGCARATVNRAMRELAEEGLLDRRRKTGTRVRMMPKRQATFEIPIVRREIEEQGAAYRYALVRRGVERVPEWLQSRLSLSGDAPVLHLTCLHYTDGIPYQHEDRWINLGALPQAEQQDFSTIGPNEWLVATVPYSDAEIAFSAVNADDMLAQALDCAEGDALFQAERVTWWQNQAITYVRQVFQRGHRMTAQY